MKTENYDVVVVGFGNAAQAAAFSAHRGGGARVLVLEKAPHAKRGGNTSYSYGAQFRHVHDGIADVKPLLPHISEKEWATIDLAAYTKDDFYADIMRVTRGRAVPPSAIAGSSVATGRPAAHSRYPLERSDSRRRARR